MDRQKILESIRATLRKSGVKKAYLFGSFARKEKKCNDIDIAIAPPSARFSLLDLIGIEQEIKRKTGKKIDLMTTRSISPHFKPYIRKDMVPLYETG